MSGSVQEMMQAARTMLLNAGVPVNTQNLNAASLALAQGRNVESSELSQLDEIMAQPARTNRARSAAPAAPAATPAAAAPTMQPTANAVENVPPAPMSPNEPGTLEPTEMVTGGAAAEANVPRSVRTMTSPTANVRYRGTVNGAQRIDEADPEAGMFAGTQPRQAVDVDDPAAFGMRALAAVPVVGAAMRAGVPAAGAAANAMPNISLGMNRQAIAGPSAATPRVAAPQRMLPASSPPSGSGRIAGNTPAGGPSPTPPQLPSPQRALANPNRPVTTGRAGNMPGDAAPVVLQDNASRAQLVRSVEQMLADAAKRGDTRMQDLILQTLRGPAR